MKNIKLNALEMFQVRGADGTTVITSGQTVSYQCSCGCCYAGQKGGSSVNDNMNANHAGRLNSTCQAVAWTSVRAIQ
ncbi:MAG: hypothetical protein LBK03_03920 [Bacteroidales bacterium]|jgi:hypothetical protein|nr:hypothetical protein [Bacteroidales bacterium]